MKWIPASEQMPMPGKMVLVCTCGNHVDVRYYVPEVKGHCRGWYPGGGQVSNSYWMLLPRPPGQTDMETDIKERT